MNNFRSSLREIVSCKFREILEKLIELVDDVGFQLLKIEIEHINE